MNEKIFELEDIVKFSGLLLLAKDKSSKLIYCNENFAQLIDVESPGKILGKRDHDLFPESIANEFLSGDACVINGGSFINVQESLPDIYNNKVYQVITTKNQLKNKAGILKGVVISSVVLVAVNKSAIGMIYNCNKKIYEFQIGKETEYFTLREFDVFKNIFIGLSSKEIAKKLLLSPRTVEGYIDSIKKKLQCSYKHHIIEAAMRYGIVQNNFVSDLLRVKDTA